MQTMKWLSGRFSLTLTLLALVGLTVPALIAPAGADPDNDARVPDLGVCQNLQVPAGNDVAFHVYAKGVQIYRWDGTSWGFVAPEAVLFADPEYHEVLGIHYAGPTWHSVDGSRAAGKVLERCTADPSAIPWLLLGAVSNEGAGVFRPVTFIQRVNTVGGKEPTNPGSSPDEMVRVPYTAEYVFYQGYD